jgi:hypothetical protein
MKESWIKALLLLAIGFLGGVILMNLLQPKPAEAISIKITICHEPGRNQQTLGVDAHAVPGHLRHGDYLGACRPLPTPTPTPTATPTPTKPPQPTTRMCHWNGKDFDAIAVTRTERLRHFNAHKLDKDWLTGMDADCEYPPTPTATPTPAPQPVVRSHGEAGFTPVCYGVSHPVIPWASAERDGSDATINYVPTTGEGDMVNVVFAENPFDIIFNLGNHGLRDERPNDGSVELHDLVLSQSYWYRIANGCSRWSGIFFIPAN